MTVVLPPEHREIELGFFSCARPALAIMCARLNEPRGAARTMEKGNQTERRLL